MRRILLQAAAGFSSIDHVANRLHMSKSNQGRRLESESSSFRSITDQVKNLLAKEYLSSTGLSVADIVLVRILDGSGEITRMLFIFLIPEYQREVSLRNFARYMLKIRNHRL